MTDEVREIPGTPAAPYFTNSNTPPQPMMPGDIPPPPGVNGPFNPMMTFGEPGTMPPPPANAKPGEIYMPEFPPGLPIYKV